MKQARKILLVSAIVASTLPGCYMYHERSRVLIPGIDLDQTLEVAEMELEENRWSSVLTIWAVRDQVLTRAQAEKVAVLYFKYIKRIDSEEQKARTFSLWHITWAISNMYRLGDEDVRGALEGAYRDAEARVEQMDSRVASTHFGGEKIYMGDVHAGGRAYARSHLVVPGNHIYLQSIEDFREERKDQTQ